MNSRERVLASIAHQPVDRVPLDLGGTRVTSIHPKPLTELCRHLGLEEILPVKVMDVWQMISWVDQKVVRALGADCLPVPRLNMEFGLRLDAYYPWELPDEKIPVLMPDNFHPETQPDGSITLTENGEIVARKVPGEPYFDATIETKMRYDPPPLEEISLVDFSEEELAWRSTWAETLRTETDKFLLGDFGANLGRFGSYQEWLFHLAASPDFMEAWYDKKAAWLQRNIELYFQAVGNNIDAIYLMEDFGTQNSMLLSPEMWRKQLKPRYQEVFRWIKRSTDWKIFFHSDGAIYPIIPDLVEIGIDILNPPQTNAKGMDPKRLKDEFGQDITFWGAGVETQSTLPYGTPDDVRKQVRDRLDLFSKGSGYVFSSIHNIQKDIPFDNLIAYFDGIKSYG